MGRLTEALAWSCLECELHPDNVAARALKEQLKGLSRFGDGPPPTPSERRRSHVQWSGLAGMRELRAMLERDVILPLRMPRLYAKYRLSLPNGLLLYGPRGCGKTFVARKLSELLAYSFMEVTPSDLGSTYVHGSQLAVRKLFDRARENAPTMLFFDEFDALVPSRDGVTHEHYAQAVNEFLVQLNECHSQRLFVVAATNLVEKIDPAVLRPGRMDKHIYVGPPDLEARVELFRLYLAGRSPASTLSASGRYLPATRQPRSNMS